MSETTKQELLRRAARLIGVEELAARLKAPASLVEAWMNGHATMPERKLILLADIVDKIAARPE